MSVSVSVKRASIVLALGAAFAGAGLVTRAQDAAAPARPQADMQKISTAFGGLRGGAAADASKNEASLAALATMEAASVSAKGEMPPTITALPEADRPAKVVAYKKEMIKLIRQELDAEEAILSGDNAKAGELVAAMGATQTEGHTEFRGRGGRGGGGGRGPGGGGGAPPAGGAPGAGQ